METPSCTATVTIRIHSATQAFRADSEVKVSKLRTILAEWSSEHCVDHKLASARNIAGTRTEYCWYSLGAYAIIYL